jgi:hypothetical protein
VVGVFDLVVFEDTAHDEGAMTFVSSGPLYFSFLFLFFFFHRRPNLKSFVARQKDSFSPSSF